MKAEIYTKKDCIYCVRAKQLLEQNKIDFHEYIISPGMGEKPLTENQSYINREQLLEKYPAAKTVPQICIDDQHIGGYENFVQWLKNK